MLTKIKDAILFLLPKFILHRYWHYLRFQKMKKVSNRDIFENIYLSNSWGKSDDPSEKFYSGPGSHRSSVISPYLTAIESFVKEFDYKMDVVDLGCGDFAVGSQLRKYFNSFVACDVVEPLILWNREKYKELEVDFRVLDLISEELPSGDIVFIRQVFQHLSNGQIMKVLPKLLKNYKYLILTEHIPSIEKFKTNIDKPAGPDIRGQLVYYTSGIVLTESPFNLKIQKESVLCDVYDEDGGIIRTIAYTLNG